uniref:Ras-related protein Rab-26 n=1 Tax=Magallana gigas TaxID=29159 RepID=K1PHU4_MAGGI
MASDTSKPKLRVIANASSHQNDENINDNVNVSAEYDEATIHKTILVGDSGVGKTSLLVQFDQGRFQAGSFSATVGIGFTIPPRNLVQSIEFPTLLIKPNDKPNKVSEHGRVTDHR